MDKTQVTYETCDQEDQPLYTKRDKLVGAGLVTLFAVGCLASSVEDMVSLLLPAF